MSEKKPKLSIVIPAYNEALRITATLESIIAFEKDWQHGPCELLIVDDGSTDGTAAVIDPYLKENPWITYVPNRKNKGKGGVVAQGMLLAKGDWRLFTDADGSTPIQELTKLWSYTTSYDVIIGSRHLDPSSIKIKQSIKRRVFSRLVNRMLQVTVLPGIVDTQCGFKLFSAQATTEVFGRQRVKGWLFDAELLTITRQRGLSIIEVPVDWYDAAQSQLRTASTAMRTLQELGIIWRSARTGVYREKN
jgi:dolichyl-phosphate beta-glucosyltransferase